MNTELQTLNNDKHLYTVQATSFPDGVKAAFERLGQISGNTTTTFKDIFGISYMGPDGKIIYKAAAPETFEGEAAKKGCESFTMKKGTYYCHTIKDWEKHMDQFQVVFEELLKHPELDPQGACVEWYKGVNEVLCMVRLKDKK
jgi:predicted transcriptional regulator YdeE